MQNQRILGRRTEGPQKNHEASGNFLFRPAVKQVIKAQNLH